MKTTYLKPCPFCGGERIIIRYGANGWTSNVYEPRATAFVECDRCKNRTEKCLYAKKAVEKWNRRVDDGNT